MLLAACGSPLQQRPAPPAAVSAGIDGMPLLPDAHSLPPAPRTAVERSSSAADLQQQGGQRIADSGGGGVYVPAGSPDALVLVSPKGALETGQGSERRAWALYRFDGLLAERPVRLRVDAAETAAQPGGVPVELRYFVGVADRTLSRWEWHGPLAQDADILLNGPQGVDSPLRQRTIDAGGVFFACVLTDSHGALESPGNPLGKCAVHIGAVTLTVSEQALDTKPLYQPPLLVKTGASAGGKQPSALLPVQFPVVEWQEYQDPGPGFFQSSASEVQVWRQGPDDSQPLLVSSLSPALESFIDPLNLAAGTVSARGGTTYRYFLCAANSFGSAAPAAAALVTVPILAPQLPVASLNSPGGTGTTLSWQTVDGAVRYRIYRGGFADASDAVEIGAIDSELTTYLDATGLPGSFYWYFIQAEGRGDGRAHNGLEGGALSPLSAPAQGLRGVLLKLSCISDGIGGNGTVASPYLLGAGEEYQFAAADQLGNPLTAVSSFSVNPPEAAQFAGTPGLLSGVQPGAGDFEVSCTFSFAGFIWTAAVHCRAQ